MRGKVWFSFKPVFPLLETKCHGQNPDSLIPYEMKNIACRLDLKTHSHQNVQVSVVFPLTKST